MTIDPSACLEELRNRDVIPAGSQCVFVAGSLVRGWGNVTSDLDFYVISDDGWSGEYVEAASVNLAISTVPANAFYVGDRRWDIEYWRTAQIDQLLDEISWAKYDNGALRDRSFNGYEINVIERMAYGLPLVGADWLAAAQRKLKESALATHLVTKRLHLADVFIEDAVGQLQSGDHESAVLSARSAFGAAVDALMASSGEFGAKLTWRARRFRLVKQDVLSFEEYWRIETMASYQDRRPAAWVEEVLDVPADSDERGTVKQSDLVVVPRLDLRIRNSGGAFLLGWRDVFLEMADVAAFMWRQVDGTRTIEDIASLVAAEYDVDLREATEDVEAVLTGLAQAQFVRLVPAGQTVRRWY